MDRSKPPKRTKARRRQRPLLEPLEPRLLLSADLPIVPVEVALPTPEPAVGTHADLGDGLDDAGVAVSASRRELIVLDGRLENVDALIADLEAKRGGDTRFEFVVLNEQESGAAQIGRALAAYDGDLDALHIFSHGSDQGLLLGGDWFTQQDLTDPSGGVGGWQRALSGDADLLLYGCDLASSAEGRAFLASLSDLTGADVAASDDLTGNAAAGGDWQLEYQRGEIESANAFGAGALASFGGTLDGTAIWVEAGDPSPETSQFNGTDFDPEGDADTVSGPWQVMDGAEAPTRDEKIIVGVDANRKLSGQIWDGSNWTAFSFNDLATVSDSWRWGFAVAYESQSGDALLVYNNGSGGSDSLSYRIWDGSSWSGANTINTPLSGEASQMKLAASPSGDEMVLVVSNAANQDYALVWNGDSWGNEVALHDGTGALSNTDVSVAYEQQSGDAMVIYGKADSDAYYRVWNGATWSGEGTIGAHASVTGTTKWTVAASDPTSDRLIIGALTQDRDVWFSIWDGNSWGPAELGTTNSAGNATYNMAVAFESQSGDAMVTYSKFDEFVYYKSWSGGTWSGEGVAYNLGAFAITSTMTLSSDPGSDRIMLSTLDSQFDVNFALWDGTSWDSTTYQLEGNASAIAGQPFLFLWDRDSTLAPEGPRFWISTDQDGVGEATTGIDSWGNEDVLQISDVRIEPGVSAGTFSIAVDLSSGQSVNAAHYVSRDIQVGASNFQLKEGDLLLSFSGAGTLTSALAPTDAGFTNSLAYTAGDVIVYRPGTAGDYSSGTFAMLLESPIGAASIRGITLLESNTTIGDYTASAGDFLFLRSGGAQSNDIWLFRTGDVGTGNTAGSADILIEGSAVGVSISSHLYSIEVLETSTTIGGRVFAAGTLLTNVQVLDDVGSNNLTVANNDIFALHVTNTELGSGPGASAATAELVFQGADAGLGPTPDRIDAFTLIDAATNTAPTIAGTLSAQPVADNATLAPFSTVVLGDADGNSISIKVQLDDAAKGTLSGGGFSDLGGGLYEFSGSVAAAEAALQALVFNPTENRVAPGLTETTTFTLTVSDGINPVSDNATTVVASDWWHGDGHPRQ
jgi:hypothetical protein